MTKPLINFTEKDLRDILDDLEKGHPHRLRLADNEIESLIIDIRADPGLWGFVSKRVEWLCRHFLARRTLKEEGWNT